MVHTRRVTDRVAKQPILTGVVAKHSEPPAVHMHMYYLPAFNPSK